MRLKYNIPTVDSLIAATGLTEGVKHVLTRDDRHFEPIINLIKSNYFTVPGVNKSYIL
ncbi:hypothetical protein KJ656_04820 [bacterium]|nr:hypothetical protein [bacterium]